MDTVTRHKGHTNMTRRHTYKTQRHTYKTQRTQYHDTITHWQDTKTQPTHLQDEKTTIHTLMAGPPPPRGGVSYLAGSLTENPEEVNLPWSNWYKYFEGGPLPPGSWLGNMPNTRPPQGGGGFLQPTYKTNGQHDTFKGQGDTRDTLTRLEDTYRVFKGQGDTTYQKNKEIQQTLTRLQDTCRVYGLV